MYKGEFVKRIEYMSRDIIHFLNTGMSDCIILESGGRFAMIDAGEDSEYPKHKPYLKYRGYEKEILEYLLKNCKGADGRVTLDFIMGTHAHSDHLGGFDTVIDHDEIMVKKAYLKPYHHDKVFITERIFWDNEEVYKETVDALRRKCVPVSEVFDREKITLGNFTITFYNGEHKKRKIKFGENINSVVTLVEKNGVKVLLAGDMNYKNGDEKLIAREVGKVNLLKVGHHGTVGSTSVRLLKALMPEYAVVTNKKSGIFPDVRLKLEKISKSEIMTTVETNGIAAVIEDSGEIRFEKEIM